MSSKGLYIIIKDGVKICFYDNNSNYMKDFLGSIRHIMWMNGCDNINFLKSSVDYIKEHRSGCGSADDLSGNIYEFNFLINYDIGLITVSDEYKNILAQSTIDDYIKNECNHFINRDFEYCILNDSRINYNESQKAELLANVLACSPNKQLQLFKYITTIFANIDVIFERQMPINKNNNCWTSAESFMVDAYRSVLLEKYLNEFDFGLLKD